jgi:hypothetical protein
MFLIRKKELYIYTHTCVATGRTIYYASHANNNGVTIFLLDLIVPCLTLDSINSRFITHVNAIKN